MGSRLGYASLAFVLLAVPPAFAQRASDNAAAAADDAFGTTVGNESVGLYGLYNARGFSPAQAGNVRIEGLYFDQQSQPNNRVVAGNTVHVGISAQSYPFPAPTGIADFHLRLPGEARLTSVYLGYGPNTTKAIEVDTQVPIVAERLSIGFGGDFTHFDADVGVVDTTWNAAFTARWHPADDMEVVGFWSRMSTDCCKQQPVVFTAGAFLPPRLPNNSFWGQQWTHPREVDSNFGMLGSVALSDWTLRVGLFRSEGAITEHFADFLADVQANGSGRHFIIAQPPSGSGSTSGEVRLSRLVSDGPRRHLFVVSLRGRDVNRRFGGSDVLDFGTAFVGEPSTLPKPAFSFGPLSYDHARQGTAGVAYNLFWKNIGEVGFGVQKTFYHRELQQPTFPLAKSTASPILYNATASVFLSQSLALYAGYTRGLEESGTAPPSTVNRGEAMPPAITQQIDAGFRYTITPTLKFVAGVFQVEKPYFNINAANVYGALGQVRHRGVELSLSGDVFTRLNVVGGMTMLQPRLAGEPVARGVVGRIPPGPRPLFSFVTLTYRPPSWDGLAFDTTFTHSSGKFARSDNQSRVSAWNEVNFGVRYMFALASAPASVRAQVTNLTNRYTLDADSGSAFFTRNPRRFSTSLAVDF